MAFLPPIFIVGTERSGSNLLMAVLNAHSNIAIPHPVSLMNDFSRFLKFYGDISQEDNFRALLCDMIAYVKWNHDPWVLDLNADEIFERCSQRSVTAIFDQIYTEYAKSKNKERWGCKALNIIHYIPQVNDYFSDMKVIHLVRDPRDVALSFKKIDIGSDHVYYSSLRWSREQKKGIRHLESDLYKKKIFVLRYEDFISSMEECVLRLCDFIEEPFESGMLQYYKREDVQASSKKWKAWKNACNPVMKSNFNKFINELSKNEIETIERVTAGEMPYFGYEPYFADKSLDGGVGAVEFSIFRRACIYLVNIFMKIKKMVFRPAFLRGYCLRNRKRSILLFFLLRRLAARIF